MGAIFSFTYSRKAAMMEEEVRNKMKDSCRKLNVLVVGLAGAGKSSLITSMRYSLTHVTKMDEQDNNADENKDDSSRKLRRYPMITEDMDSELCKFTPYVFDMPGLPDSDDDSVRDVLRRVMQGRIQAGEDIFTLKTDSEIDGVESENKIDRVIFVHSSEKGVPHNLTHSLMSICRELDIITFSVLTHIDVKDKLCTDEELELAMGTAGSPRSFSVELYHHDEDTSEKPAKHKEMPKTNYFLLGLWRVILNENYPTHSVFE